MEAPWIPLGPTGPSPLPGPTKRLGWLGSWTPTGTAFSELELDLPSNCVLNSWTAHSTLELLSQLLNCFLNSWTAHSTLELLTQLLNCSLNSWTAFSTLELLTQLLNCSLNSWTAFSTLELLLTVLLWAQGSCLKCPGVYRNHRSSLLKCGCWLVTAGTQIHNEPRVRDPGNLPWIRANVWLLRNTS
jgi:hypothetical protein